MKRKRLGIIVLILTVVSALIFITACPTDPSETATEILSFVFAAADNDGIDADVTATIDGTDISVSVPNDTDITGLAPTITISDGASVSPASGKAQDFSAPVTYTVTAADGETTASYEVKVSIAANDAKEITGFVFAAADNTELPEDSTGTINGTDISATVPYNTVIVPYHTDVSALTPTITVSSDAEVDPASGTPKDFTNAVNYTVTAEDGTAQEYTVTVTIADPTPQTVESSGDAGLYFDITTDSNNNLHIVYEDDPNNSLKYATNASGSWQNETVDSSVLVTDSYCSITIDSNDNVHISYLGGGELRYATNGSGSWNSETVDTAGQIGRYTSIATDSNDTIHISYYDDTNKNLKYATGTYENWDTETVDSADTDEVGRSTSIAVDSSNTVHISYYDDTNGALKYATGTYEDWNTETVDSSGGFHTSIAVDSGNNVHISYHASNDLQYATGTAGSWSIETLDSSGWVGRYTSLAVDSNDNVHISYSQATDDLIKYATDKSGSWITKTIDSSGNAGSETALTVDSNNEAHILYQHYYSTDYLEYYFE